MSGEHGEPAVVTRPPGARACICCALVLTLLSHAGSATAGGPLGQDGEPLRTSNYKVDLTQTPVLAGSRVTGIAGSYVAIAEGTDGNTQTPVAPAVRPSYSYDYFDYDLAVGVTLTSVLRNTDFFNTGRNTQLDTKQGGFVFITPAANLTWGDFGMGLTLELQHYELSQNQAGAGGGTRQKLDADFAVGHLQSAYAFWDKQLVAGVGARIVSLSLTETNAGQELFSTEGVGAELGLLWKPNNRPYRVGASFRSSVTTTAHSGTAVQPDANGDRVVGGGPGEIDALWLPSNVTLPWDVNAGLALMLGPRRFNPMWYHDEEGLSSLRAALEQRRARRRQEAQRWLERARKQGQDTEAMSAALRAEDEQQLALEELELVEQERRLRELLKERSAANSRLYLLLSMSLLVTGPVQNAVGVESFLGRTVHRSGEDIVLSPRLGLETETVPNWVKVRLGTYGEPTRSAGGNPRIHGTLGIETKVFPWNVFGLWADDSQWRISAALDVAQRYLGWGLAIGNWY